MSLEDFSELWTQSDRYVLVRVPNQEGGIGLVILDREDRSVELIDDDELNEAVIHRMIDAGVPILDEFP